MKSERTKPLLLVKRINSEVMCPEIRIHRLCRSQVWRARRWLVVEEEMPIKSSMLNPQLVWREWRKRMPKLMQALMLFLARWIILPTCRPKCVMRYEIGCRLLSSIIFSFAHLLHRFLDIDAKRKIGKDGRKHESCHAETNCGQCPPASVAEVKEVAVFRSLSMILFRFPINYHYLFICFAFEILPVDTWHMLCRHRSLVFWL